MFPGVTHFSALVVWSLVLASGTMDIVPDCSMDAVASAVSPATLMQLHGSRIHSIHTSVH